MRIFVAGGGGFVGAAVVRHLEKLGHEVIGHVSSRDGALLPGSVPQGVQLIVNAAGKLGKPGVTEEQLTSSNVLLAGMLAALCDVRGIPLIHISTPGVAGLRANSGEDSPPAPWGAYERSKAAGEALTRKHLALPGGLLTILRPDFVYGPGDLHKLELFRQVSGGVMPLIGRRGAVLRPTFVDDVCMAVSASLPGGCLQGGLFHIGGPETVCVRELTQIIATALGRRVLLLPLPRPVVRLALRAGPLRPAALSESRVHLFGEDHYVSIEKALRAGFVPATGLREGIVTTIAWYRQEGLLRG